MNLVLGPTLRASGAGPYRPIPPGSTIREMQEKTTATATCEVSSKGRQSPSPSWMGCWCWEYGNRSSSSISIPDHGPGNSLFKSWGNDQDETRVIQEACRLSGALAHQLLSCFVNGGVGEAVGCNVRRT